MRKVYKGQSILQAMDNLSQLVDRIQRSAGYEVFCHAIGRRDLNDFGDDRSYIRAVHNIRNPVARVSSPLRDDIVRDVCHEHTYSGDFNVVSYGILATRGLVEREENVPVVSLVRRSGLFGRFLPKTKGKTGETVRRRIRREGYTHVSLNKIVETDDTSPAYFTRLTIPAEILDSAGRHGLYPSISIVSNKALSAKIVQYLKDAPKDYNVLLEATLKDQPNVTEGIIRKVKPVSTIFFVDRESVDSGKLRELYGHSEWEKAYFEKVAERKVVF